MQGLRSQAGIRSGCSIDMLYKPGVSRFVWRARLRCPAWRVVTFAIQRPVVQIHPCNQLFIHIRSARPNPEGAEGSIKRHVFCANQRSTQGMRPEHSFSRRFVAKRGKPNGGPDVEELLVPRQGLKGDERLVFHQVVHQNRNTSE